MSSNWCCQNTLTYTIFMSYLKFGFHTAGSGLGVPREFYEELNQAGIPFMAKGADSLPFDAQQIAQNSTVPHIIVFRRSIGKYGFGVYDVPDYTLSPIAAAFKHWQLHKDEFPQDLDRHITWVETINEVDKNRSEWLAEFSIQTAHLAMNDGYKYAAFGWSTGEPELIHWEGSKMLDFLRLCGQNPDKIAISLHEYSLDTNNIWNGTDSNGKHWLIGRFEHLYDICDRHLIPRPTILITEWGWELNNVPSYERAMQDYLSVGELYAKYPQVKGAATWYLGGEFDNIKDKTILLVEPLKQLTKVTRFPDTQLGYKSIPILMPQNATLSEMKNVHIQNYAHRRTITQSHDEALQLVHLGNEGSYLIIYNIHHWPTEIQQMLLSVPHELRSI